MRICQYIYIYIICNKCRQSVCRRSIGYTYAYIIYIYYIYTYIYILSLYKSVITNKHRPIIPIIIYAFRQSTISVYYNKAFIINYTSNTPVYVTLRNCLNPRIPIRKVRGSNSLKLLEFRISGFSRHVRICTKGPGHVQ